MVYLVFIDFCLVFINTIASGGALPRGFCQTLIHVKTCEGIFLRIGTKVTLWVYIGSLDLFSDVCHSFVSGEKKAEGAREYPLGANPRRAWEIPRTLCLDAWFLKNLYL